MNFSMLLAQKESPFFLSSRNRFRDMIELSRKSFSGNQEFLSLWAEYAYQQNDAAYIKELIEPPFFVSIRKSNFLIALRLLVSADRLDDAKELSGRFLEKALEHGSKYKLQKLGKLYSEIGQFEDFEKEILNRLPEKEAKSFLDSIKHRLRLNR